MQHFLIGFNHIGSATSHARQKTHLMQWQQQSARLHLPWQRWANGTAAGGKAAWPSSPMSISQGTGWRQGMAVYVCQGLRRICGARWGEDNSRATAAAPFAVCQSKELSVGMQRSTGTVQWPASKGHLCPRMNFSQILHPHWLICRCCLASPHTYVPTTAPRGQPHPPWLVCSLPSVQEHSVKWGTQQMVRPDQHSKPRGL